jgi:hypothetical protein
VTHAEWRSAHAGKVHESLTPADAALVTALELWRRAARESAALLSCGTPAGEGSPRRGTPRAESWRLLAALGGPASRLFEAMARRPDTTAALRNEPMSNDLRRERSASVGGGGGGSAVGKVQRWQLGSLSPRRPSPPSPQVKSVPTDETAAECMSAAAIRVIAAGPPGADSALPSRTAAA